MKYIVCISLLFCILQPLKAQDSLSHSVYYSAAFNIGNYKGIDVSLHYIRDHKHSIKIGYSGNFRKAISTPSDYNTGLIGAIFLGLIDPLDQLETFQIQFGRLLPLNEAKTIRLDLAVGLGHTILQSPTNWTKLTNNIISENYTWETEKRTTLSFIFNPRIEFLIAKYFGLTVSPQIQWNPKSAYYGIGIGHMIGVF